ncbi:MAG TPA: hypothetical protein VKG80_12460 [Trebonia sp.]|nr:hypothetical protein [Trebonia sp.]
MRLIVFLHGTVIMHSAAVGCSRAERVTQVMAKDPSVRDYAGYVPVDGAVAKLRGWADAGGLIDYLSSHEKSHDVAADKLVLRTYGFPGGHVFSRQPSEMYSDIAERELPDVLIEDDCESIGARHITYPHISAAVRGRIKSIVVPEFGGIDHLPDNPGDLVAWRP